MKCDWCVRRVREQGGNGSCPLFHHLTTDRLAKSGNLVAERRPVAESWKHHTTIYPAGCVNFKAGDLKPPPVAVEQESLFA